MNRPIIWPFNINFKGEKMPTKSNEIECPHCKEVIDISLLQKENLLKNLKVRLKKTYKPN